MPEWLKRYIETMGGEGGIGYDPGTGAFTAPYDDNGPSELSPDLRAIMLAGNATEAAIANSNKEVSEVDRKAIFETALIAARKQTGAREPQVDDVTAAAEAAARAVKPAAKGSGVGSDLGSAPEGFVWATPPGGGVPQLVDARGRQGRTPAEENASNASANASNASAAASMSAIARIQYEMARDRIIDQAIADGKLKETSIQGVYMTPKGDIYDKTKTDLDKERVAIERGGLDELIRSNGEKAAIDRGRLANEQEATRQTGEYQRGNLEIGRGNLDVSRGQLDISRGELGVSRDRLAIDKARADADRLSQQQQNLLKMQEYRQKILSGSSDFIARSFAQSGQTSPDKPIRPADLLNQLAKEYNSLQPGQTVTAPNTGVPQLAMGGMVNDPMMIVGDPQHPGQPNPEVIHNPTGAPISVTPMNRLGGRVPQYAEGTPQGRLAPQIDPETKAIQTKIESVGKLLQHVDSAETQHQLVDEIAQNKSRLAKTQGEGIPAYAAGTPDYSWLDWGSGTGWGGVIPESAQKIDTTVSGAAAPASAPASAGAGQNLGSQEAVQDWLAKNTERITGSAYVAPGTPVGTAVTNTTRMPATAVAAPAVAASVAAPAPAGTVDQASLEASAEANMSGRLRQLFGKNFGQRLETRNSTPNPQQPGGFTPQRFPFALFTPQQLDQLTPDELKALNSYLGVKYNTTLEDVVTAQQQVFGRSPGTPRYGRLG